MNIILSYMRFQFIIVIRAGSMSVGSAGLGKCMLALLAIGNPLLANLQL